MRNYLDNAFVTLRLFTLGNFKDIKDFIINVEKSKLPMTAPVMKLLTHAIAKPIFQKHPALLAIDNPANNALQEILIGQYKDVLVDKNTPKKKALMRLVMGLLDKSPSAP